MALIRRTVTARMIAANRANARRSTGPRTPQGKAQSRLNALRRGARSRRLSEYLHLWFEILLTGPWEPPPRWKISEIPMPMDPCRADDPRDTQEIRRFLRRVEPYLKPPSQPRAKTNSASPPRAGLAGKGKNKESFFDQPSRQVIEKTRPQTKTNPFSGVNEPNSKPSQERVDDAPREA